MKSIRSSIRVYLCSSVVLLFLPGCGAPNKANIGLRKELQDLRAKVAQMERQRAADAATIAALQNQSSGRAVPQLEPARLDRLFTTAGIGLGKLTGGYDSDPSRPGDDAIRVQVTPKDVAGDSIKAAGSIIVEAFDLSGDGQLVGRWTYDLEQSKAAWRGNALQYAYVLVNRLERMPSTPRVTLKITFTDELTGRQFTEQRPIELKLSGGSGGS